MGNILADPNGAFRTITTYTSGRDADGIPLVIGNQDIESYRADATIVAGQAVMVVAGTATVPISVTPMTAAVSTAAPWRFWGCAMEAGSAGDQVRVCAAGIVEILHDAADTAAAYSVVVPPDTTTGRFAIATGPVDDVATIGVCLGVEVGTDKCLAYISRQGVAVSDDWVA